ncbi:phosphatidylglycerophosphatase A [Paracoccus seriniphilus]|uniref:Phosphatidylglycerophosphatase A n=1 Tax=Paracoccus seriniphilus TaxID=184748 RepID=A0A239PRR5_9RHOB|nr:phosphatidylglycerophosphatase A [Paracoccus seriniphilus]WCR12980.1 phosphatidylglycerophosphatase A [Paracoccus seriniphilus]SNT72586.1 phosphatidylglycerophosphatase A [Paracoccus seriniphilus]
MDRLLCIWFGAGLLKPAPGTWGSAVAVLLGLLLHRIGHFPLLAAATVIVTIVGFRAVRRHTQGMSDPDRSEIVIDEVAGQWLALCFPSAAFFFAQIPSDTFPYPGWLAAFLFFRLFDIWKPWLVGRADRNGGVDGVMKDDLWAGLFAGIATLLAAAFAHLVLM